MTITQQVSEIENKAISDHDLDKYITTQELHKLTADIFAARLAQGNLVSKRGVLTLEPRIVVPLIVNFSIFFHPGHLYSMLPIINFRSFLLTLLSVNNHFHQSPSKRKRNCAV